jgi:hypothetical protein
VDAGIREKSPTQDENQDGNEDAATDQQPAFPPPLTLLLGTHLCPLPGIAALRPRLILRWHRHVS